LFCVTLLIDRFSTLAPHYDVVLSDVWGVIHNGVAAFPAACDALTRFRQAGGTVILITNAPRPHQSVERQIEHLHVPRETYDDIVSSGDVTRGVIAQRPGQSVFHLGPERDRPIFEGFDLRFADVDTADYVVCSGLFNDDGETPDDYRDMLTVMRKRNLFMVCGNPDVVVERGDDLIYCAGAIADLYKSMGGDVLYAGKPYAPIYEMSLAKAEAKRNTAAPLARVLAIGDSVRTDFTGALRQGLDCLFVTAGIHSAELGGHDVPDEEAVRKIFAETGALPKAVTHRLTW
jgi:HAD superfamily hydrolase (TIGR01459 family)